MPWLVQSAGGGARWAIVLTHRSARLRARYGAVAASTAGGPCVLRGRLWGAGAPSWPATPADRSASELSRE